MRSDSAPSQFVLDLAGTTALAPTFRPARTPAPATRCQRWRAGRHSYRPAGEVITPRHYEVAEIDRATAKRFIVETHYAKSFPSPRWCFGLFYGPLLAGVAVFSWPQHKAVLTNVFPGDWEESTELGRFVLLPWVPGNGESWFLARIFEQLCPMVDGRRKPEVRGIVSFSDPVPRYTGEGREVMPGHVGTIYQASGATYLGRSRADWQDLFLDDATTYGRRTLTKLLGEEQGRRYAEKQLRAHGAPPLRAGEDPSAYVERWLPQLSRRVWHPGKHRYAFAFNRRDQRRLEQESRRLAAPLYRPLPYPKKPEVLS